MVCTASSGHMLEGESGALSQQKLSLRVYALLIRPDHGARNGPHA